MPGEAKNLSIAVGKVRKRREGGLCGACGHAPCTCKRPKRKQKYLKRQSPGLSRKR